MRVLLFILALMLFACRGERPCEVDSDCDGFERAVCDEGVCVCEFDELDRCLCDVQSRCDDVYGQGERVCAEGSCRACVRDADCGRLGRCGQQGECYAVECEADTDCAIGFCDVERNDCIACAANQDCPNGLLCRVDGACVQCVETGNCGAGEVCDVDVNLTVDIEVVGTNQCGVDCAPMCRVACADDPDCRLRPECVVDDPTCLDGTCGTWDDCELPPHCELLLGDCPAGLSCEALAASVLVPVHYACLDTPCLYDFECADTELCYEGRCLAGCDTSEDCVESAVCVPRVHFERGACLPR